MKIFLLGVFKKCKEVVLKLYWGILILFVVVIIFGFMKRSIFIFGNPFLLVSFVMSIWGAIRLISWRYSVAPFQYDRIWSILGTKRLTQEERLKIYRDICLRNATIAWLVFIPCLTVGILMEFIF